MGCLLVKLTNEDNFKDQVIENLIEHLIANLWAWILYHRRSVVVVQHQLSYQCASKYVEGT